MRLLGVILIIVGFLLFLGNATGVFPTIPGLGVGIVFVGCAVIYFLHRYEMTSAGVDEWRYNE